MNGADLIAKLLDENSQLDGYNKQLSKDLSETLKERDEANAKLERLAEAVAKMQSYLRSNLCSDMECPLSSTKCSQDCPTFILEQEINAILKQSLTPTQEKE